MHVDRLSDFPESNYQNEALKIVKQLHHPPKVLDAIKNAKSSREIATIMHVAMEEMDGNCHG